MNLILLSGNESGVPNQSNPIHAGNVQSKSADPPGQGDEDQLQGQAEPQGSGGTARDFQMLDGGFGVGGEHRDEQQDEANSGEAAESRDQQADRAGDFAEPGEVDPSHGIAKNLRDHAGHAVLGLGEVRDAGEKKHGGESPAHRRDPSGECGDAEHTSHAENQEGANEDDEDDHAADFSGVVGEYPGWPKSDARAVALGLQPQQD